jgi:hypothetical protein
MYSSRLELCWEVIKRFNSVRVDVSSSLLSVILVRNWWKIIEVNTQRSWFWYITRAVCKVRKLTLLLRVGTLWRCGDGLLYEVPPLASDASLTTLHPLLENVLQTVDHFEISCLRAPFSWLQKPRNRMGRDLNWILCSAWKKWVGGTPSEHPSYNSDLVPCDF